LAQPELPPPAPTPAPWAAVPGLLAAAARYERALREDDLAVLDELFAPGPATLRAEGGSALAGHEAISAFRAGRGGAPRRGVRRVHVRALSPADAVTVTETERADGGRGLQTQVWHLGAAGWRVTTAHVSGAPAPDGADARAAGPGDRAAGPGDRATWRVPPPAAGPLVAAAGDGALAGVRTAVKDLVALAGHRVGGGVPGWLAAAPTETATAPALQALLDAGAEVAGLAQTDELAFSLMGANAHYGTPPNPAAPGRTTGGSTSGPAAAVAAGSADLGLGTDTAGSLRVPGSFCGLYAWRPTHGAVDVTGVLPLAPSFDTVGLLARDPAVLRAAAGVLLRAGGPAAAPRALLRSATLTGLAEPATGLAVDAALAAVAVQTGLPVLDVGDDVTAAEVAAWTAAFRTVQAAEAWAAHGGFAEQHPGALSPAVEARFRAGAGLPPGAVEDARGVLAGVRARLDALLAQGWLALPSTAAPAPRTDSSPAQWDEARAATLPLTSLASAAGVPALGLPFGRVGELPVGLCVLAPRGEDRALLGLTALLTPGASGASRPR